MGLHFTWARAWLCFEIKLNPGTRFARPFMGCICSKTRLGVTNTCCVLSSTILNFSKPFKALHRTKIIESKWLYNAKDLFKVALELSFGYRFKTSLFIGADFNR
jgi:hypothetical protein